MQDMLEFMSIGVIVTKILTFFKKCVQIANLRSNVSDAQINRGWVTLDPNLGVFPLGQTRHVGVANSERPRLTNGEIIFEEFQPMLSQFTNVTEGRTDDMRSH